LHRVARIPFCRLLFQKGSVRMASVSTFIPPDIELQEDSPANKVATGSLFGGKKIVLFGVPGAFTPGCSKTHLPGYIADADKYKAKGVDEIVCITVNDAFVTGAWKEQSGATGKVRILADPNATFTKALGLDFELGVLGGIRSKRYSALVENGEIKVLNVEEDNTGLNCSLSAGLLTAL